MTLAAASRKLAISAEQASDQTEIVSVIEEAINAPDVLHFAEILASSGVASLVRGCFFVAFLAPGARFSSSCGDDGNRAGRHCVPLLDVYTHATANPGLPLCTCLSTSCEGSMW